MIKHSCLYENLLENSLGYKAELSVRATSHPNLAPGLT